jgi:hypothetical protein
VAGWNISLFQIISTLIGSGFTIFLLNSITSDFNQPQVNLNVITEDIGKSMDQTILYNTSFTSDSSTGSKEQPGVTQNKTLTEFDTIATNNGRSSATRLILQLAYPNGNITKFYTSFQSENVTIKQQSPSLLIAEASRLSKDAIIAIRTIVECNLNTDTFGSKDNTDSIYFQLNESYYNKCPPVNHIVTASYDQGSDFHTNIDTESINIDRLYAFHYRDQVLATVLTLAIISFVIALSYKRINHFRKRLARPKFVFEIVKEIITIRDTLNINLGSKRIFPIDTWYSKGDQEKLRTFNDYEDYYYLDDFYSKLKERDEIMSKKSQLRNKVAQTLNTPSDNSKNKENIDDNIDFDSPRKYIEDINRECLFLANNIITNLNWKNYQDLEDKKYYTPIAIIVTILTAFSISTAFEFYRVTLFHSNLDIPLFDYRLMYISLSVMVRSIIFFILSREIINFKTLFAYEVGKKNNILSFFILDKKAQLKLLIFSFIIGGTPVLPILTGFHLISEEIHLFTIDLSGGYLLFATSIVLDVILFLVLVIAIPRFIMKEKTIKV